MGDKGDSVKWLQRALAKLGYFSGSADGEYGQKTDQAVKAYLEASLSGSAQLRALTGKEIYIAEEDIHRLCAELSRQ